MKSEQIKHSLSVGIKSIQSRVFDRETDEVISFVKIPIKDSGLVRREWVETTQVTKVWWDGEKLMAKEIPEKDIYWNALTTEDMHKAWEWAQKSSPYGVDRIETFARAIDAKLKDKNIRGQE